MTELSEINNSLSSLATSLYTGGALGAYGNTAQVSSAETLVFNNRWYLISNLRNLVSELYVEHGIVQTLIDQPVDDAFSRGIEIKSSQLSGDDVEELLSYIDGNQVIETIKYAIKWKRLYGGGGIIIIDKNKPDEPLDINSITPDSDIRFKAVDMWELYNHNKNYATMGDLDIKDKMDADDEFFQYYDKRIHSSRVLRLIGKEAPSFIRPRLRGWGMSELEKVVRSFNQYLKNQDVIFELMDEAKIDVYGIAGFNQAMLTSTGTTQVANRIQNANMIKNYNNAITMDVNDKYEQKQMTFTGLSELLKQIREGIAADLKMPVTKLFGISSAGFNSGEDDIENYNAMIESEVRSKDKHVVLTIIKICCQKLFGVIPDDLMIAFPSLRVMSTLDEEQAKNHQFNRVMMAYQSGAIDGKVMKESINKESLLPVELDENVETDMPIEGDFTVSEGGSVDAT